MLHRMMGGGESTGAEGACKSRPTDESSHAGVCAHTSSSPASEASAPRGRGNLWRLRIPERLLGSLPLRACGAPAGNDTGVAGRRGQHHFQRHGRDEPGHDAGNGRCLPDAARGRECPTAARPTLGVVPGRSAVRREGEGNPEPSPVCRTDIPNRRSAFSGHGWDWTEPGPRAHRPHAAPLNPILDHPSRRARISASASAGLSRPS